MLIGWNLWRSWASLVQLSVLAKCILLLYLSQAVHFSPITLAHYLLFEYRLTNTASLNLYAESYLSGKNSKTFTGQLGRYLLSLSLCLPLSLGDKFLCLTISFSLFLLQTLPFLGFSLAMFVFYSGVPVLLKVPLPTSEFEVLND